MTDFKNMMSDDELDAVVGGNAAAFILPGEKEGVYTVISCKTSGDVDKMKQLIAGGSADSINFSGSFSRMSVAADKLDSYIERLQKRDPGMDIIRV